MDDVETFDMPLQEWWPEYLSLNVASAWYCEKSEKVQFGKMTDLDSLTHANTVETAYLANAAKDLDLWKRPRADGLGHPVLLGSFRSPTCNYQINPELFAASRSHCDHLSRCHGPLFWHCLALT